MAQENEASQLQDEEIELLETSSHEKDDDDDDGLDPNAWMVTFSDLITLMMTFFVLLYSFNDPNPVQTQSSVSSDIPGFLSMAQPLPVEQVQVLRANSLLKESLEVFLAENSLRNIDVTRQEEDLIVTIPADILFSKNSAVLGAKAKQTIQDIGKYLLESGHDIRIEGHTDNTPVRSRFFRDSWELSLARANNVLKEMLSLGMPSERLSLVGNGAAKPRESNQTPNGRRLNRRVDIVIVNPALRQK